MSPVARRIAAPVKSSGGSANFGDDAFYSGGLGLPEGDYALLFNTQMFQPTKQNGTPAGAPFLCVMMTAYPLAGGEPAEHPLSCGRKAHESFVPSEDGKGFDPVPGGPAIGMSDMSNWSIFRKSLRDSGLPDGILVNDLSAIDGIWVHTQNIPEPEERKAFRSATGEAALNPQEQMRTRTTVVVSEIQDDGKPWEGTGGIDNLGQAKAAPKAVAGRRVAPVAARPVAPVASRRIAPVVEEAPEEVSEEDLQVAAMNGCTEFLTNAKYAKGCTKIQLRTGCFVAVSKAQGEDMANAVIETYFGSDDALNTILGELRYVSAGGQVKVA